MLKYSDTFDHAPSISVGYSTFLPQIYEETNLVGLSGPAYHRCRSIPRVLRVHLYACHCVVRSPAPAADRRPTPARSDGSIGHSSPFPGFIDARCELRRLIKLSSTTRHRQSWKEEGCLVSPLTTAAAQYMPLSNYQSGARQYVYSSVQLQ